MADNEDIRQRIIIEADDQASATLAKIIPAINALEKGLLDARRAFRDFGTSASELGSSLSRLESSMTRMARNTTFLVTAVGGAATLLFRFGASAVRAADDLGDLAAALGVTTQKYQELRAAAAEAGVTQRQFQGAMTNFSKQLDVDAQKSAKALLDFVEATKQKPHPNIRDVGPIVNTFNAVREGAAKLTAELNKRGIKNNLVETTEYLRGLATGTDEMKAKFETLTGVELPGASAGLKKLRDEAGQGKSALERLGVQVARNADGSIDLVGSLERVGRAFQESNDPIRDMSIATQLFGRQAGPKLLKALKSAEGGVNSFVESAKKAGVSFREFGNVEAADQALAKLELAAENTKLALADVFAPTIGAVAEGLTQIITGNEAALVSLGKSINTSVLPYVQAFFDMLSGTENVTEAGEFMSDLREKAIALGTAVKGAIDNIIVPAFRALMAILGEVARVFNSVFGTNLTGEMIAAAIVIGKLTGAFGFLFAAASTVVGVFRVLASLVGWPAVLVGGLVFLVGQLDSVKSAAQGVADVMNSLFGTKFTGAEVANGALAAIAATLLTIRANAILASAALTTLMAHPIVRTAAALFSIFQAIDKGPEIFDEKGKSLGRLGDVINEKLKAVGTNPGPEQAAQKVDTLTASTNKAAQSTDTLAKNITNVQQSLKDNADPTFGGRIKTVPKPQEQSKTTAADAQATAAAAGAVAAKTAEIAGNTQQIVTSVTGVGTEWERVVASTTTMNVNQDAAISKAGGLSQGFSAIAATDISAPVVTLNGVLDETLAKLKAAIDAAIALSRVPPPAGASGGNPQSLPPAFASGGQVRGRGGIDKIPAWLTRDEFVMRTAAVRKYGVGFMKAINEGRLTLPGYAAGGPVSHQGAPGYITGGLTKGEKTYTKSQVESILFDILRQIEDGIRGIAQGWNQFANSVEKQLNDMTARFAELAANATPANAVQSVNEMARSMEGLTQSIVSSMVSTARNAESHMGRMVEAVKFAGGGQVHGTPGRDKVPAWLTNKEFVMKTAAVRKYGVGFMHAVNEGRLKIPALEFGGMIADGFKIPRYAGGGSVGISDGGSSQPSGRPLVLQMPDGSRYEGSMPSNTADALERDVLKKRPAGRRQRWKR